MSKHRLLTCAAVLAGLSLAMATPVQALPLSAIELPAVAIAALGAATSCDGRLAPAFGQAPSAPKSSAILGGQVSQLDLIRQQQAGGDSTIASAAANNKAGAGLTPAAAPVACQSLTRNQVQNLAMPSIPSMAVQPGPGLPATNNPDDFLASKRLAVRKTVFDGEWNRVSHQGLSRHFATALFDSGSGAPTLATLTAVNAWSNTRIRYEEDSQLYGRADYWANASTTLSRGAGDCEDIAIVKMQILAALGVPRSDMYLTIARDLARHADHALLVVKLGGSYWLLDNATNRPLEASQSYDYQPVLSFSGSHKWLHGY